MGSDKEKAKSCKVMLPKLTSRSHWSEFNVSFRCFNLSFLGALGPKQVAGEYFLSLKSASSFV